MPDVGMLLRMLGRSGPRDGAAASLEAPATGLDLANFTGPAAEPPIAAAIGRDRSATDGDDALVIAITSKLLNGWLQNRQQTLYPLTLNFRTLDPQDQATLADILAIAVRADDRTKDHAEDASRCRSWLASVGASGPAIGVFDQALTDPPALGPALHAALDHDLSAYSYVVALVGSDPQSVVSQRFLDYLEAWLELPTAVVRSAVRKYRR